MSWVSSPSKLEEASLFLKFDFISLIPEGMGMSNPVYTASVYTGDDAEPLVVEESDVEELGTCLYVPVSGGEAGVIYEVTCMVEIGGGDDLNPQSKTLRTLVAVISTNSDAQPE